MGSTPISPSCEGGVATEEFAFFFFLVFFFFSHVDQGGVQDAVTEGVNGLRGTRGLPGGQQRAKHLSHLDVRDKRKEEKREGGGKRDSLMRKTFDRLPGGVTGVQDPLDLWWG